MGPAVGGGRFQAQLINVVRGRPRRPRGGYGLTWSRPDQRSSKRRHQGARCERETTTTVAARMIEPIDSTTNVVVTSSALTTS